MSIYEYDEEKHIQHERVHAHAEGLRLGIEQGKILLLKSMILEFYKNQNTLSEDVKKKVNEETDFEVLNKWYYHLFHNDTPK